MKSRLTFACSKQRDFWVVVVLATSLNVTKLGERGRQTGEHVDEVDEVLGVNVRLWILDFSK